MFGGIDSFPKSIPEATYQNGKDCIPIGSFFCWEDILP